MEQGVIRWLLVGLNASFFDQQGDGPKRVWRIYGYHRGYRRRAYWWFPNHASGLRRFGWMNLHSDRCRDRCRNSNGFAVPRDPGSCSQPVEKSGPTRTRSCRSAPVRLCQAVECRSGFTCGLTVPR